VIELLEVVAAVVAYFTAAFLVLLGIERWLGWRSRRRNFPID
jgi:hypothetical protein